MFMRRFYDDADGSGGSATDADKSKAAGNDGGAGESGSTDNANTGGDDKDKKPAEPTVESLMVTLKERDGKIADLSTRLGKQSSSVKTVRDYNDRLNSDPVGLLNDIARQTGTKIRIGGDKSTSVRDMLLSDDETVRVKAADDMLAREKEDAAVERINQRITPVLDSVLQGHLRAQFADFGDLAEDRDAIKAAISMGKLSKDEIFHYAARGMHLDAAITDAKAQGVEEYKEQLRLKNDGQVDTGGRGKDLSDKDKQLKMSDVASGLNKARRY